MKNRINFSIFKKIIVIMFFVSALGACSSQRHRPKPPTNKGGCNCPHFMYGNFMNNFDNQIYDVKG